MFPANSSASYLACSSKDDVAAIQPGFNPADFSIVVPNSIKLQDVVRVCATCVSVPRMFTNINEGFNNLYWYQRAIQDLPTADPTMVFRTVNPDWVITDSLTFTPGLYGDIETLIDEINTHRAATLGPDVETWSINMSADPVCVLISVAVTEVVPITWGLVPNAPPPSPYANMTYLTCTMNNATGPDRSDSTLFDFFGLDNPSPDIQTYQNAAGQIFDPTNPNTFGSFNGLMAGGTLYTRNFANMAIFPLFDSFAFDYYTWSHFPYVTPQLTPPNTWGPQMVYITVSDIGDLNTVYGKTGTNYDVIAAVNLSNVAYGAYAFKEIKDGEYEAIGLKQPRNITGLRIRILDEQFRQTFLLPNFAAALRLQLVYISR